MTSRDVYFFGNACAFSSRKAVSVPTPGCHRRPGGSMATSHLVRYSCVCVCVCVCDRGFSMFSHRKIAELCCFFCSVIFLGGWLSFEPNFDAQLALEVPQRAFRPSFSDPSHSRDRRFDLADSAFDFEGCRPRIDAVLSPVFGI